jgi:hypothetical protein
MTLWNVLDYTGDILFLLDIYLNFRCAVMHDGMEVKEQAIIGTNGQGVGSGVRGVRFGGLWEGCMFV